MTDILNETVPIKVVMGIVLALFSVLWIVYYLKLKKKKGEIAHLIKKSNSDQLFQTNADTWIENSKNALLHVNSLPPNEINALNEELGKRKLLYNTYKPEQNMVNITIDQLPGSYHVIGYNQNEKQSKYFGYLYLTKTGNCRVHAEWVIAGEQTQVGTGFYNNNILVINFTYKGEANKDYKGVVVYKVLNEFILNRFWSEKHADDTWLGIEEGRKLAHSETIANFAALN